MSYIEMQAELRGLVPKFPIAAAPKIINRAYKDVRRQNLWSFQLFESILISPSQVNVGTATVVQGSNQVVFDAVGKAAVNASITTYSLISQRQFRVGVSRVYNVWDWDAVNGIATLDTIYGEVSGAFPYRLYQCYYAPPMKDFLTFVSVRNTTIPIKLNTNRNRAWLDSCDPQRIYLAYPTHIVPFMLDLNPSSSTYQFPMQEVWSAPLQNWTFQVYGLRQGVDLVSPTDTLPPQIGEDCVIERAKYFVYEWAESSKGTHTELMKSDWKFLMSKADAEYKRLFRDYRRRDREYIDLWFSERSIQGFPMIYPEYSSITGVAFSGLDGWGS